jgi:hypothetical protein
MLTVHNIDDDDDDVVVHSDSILAELSDCIVRVWIGSTFQIIYDSVNLPGARG